MIPETVWHWAVHTYTTAVDVHLTSKSAMVIIRQVNTRRAVNGNLLSVRWQSMWRLQTWIKEGVALTWLNDPRAFARQNGNVFISENTFWSVSWQWFGVGREEPCLILQEERQFWIVADNNMIYLLTKYSYTIHSLWLKSLWTLLTCSLYIMLSWRVATQISADRCDTVITTLSFENLLSIPHISAGEDFLDFLENDRGKRKINLLTDK